MSPFDGSAAPPRWTLAAAPRLVCAWWAAEFTALFPAAFAGRWIAGGERQLTLKPAGGDVTMEMARAGRVIAASRVTLTAFSSASVAAFLAARGAARNRTHICLQAPDEDFFFRSFDIPVEARAKIGDLAALEIARKTPFHVDKILHGHEAAEIEGGRKLRVRQAIIRRDLVAQRLAGLALRAEDIDAVVGVETAGAAIMAPLRERRVRRSKFGLLLAGLALTALLLGGAVLGATAWRQQQILEQLNGEIAAVRAKSAQVRAKADRFVKDQTALARIRSQKAATPALVEILEEATRLLPNDTWATEIRLSEVRPGEKALAIAGLAPAAASLIDLLDRSPMFAEAALSAPIMLDPEEGRERFALRANIRTRGTPPENGPK